MPSGTWALGWATNDLVTVPEFAKGMGSIFDQTLSIAQANFDVTPIVGSYAHLLLEGAFLSDQAANQNVNIAFNNDTTATNYSRNAPQLAAAYTGGQANDNRSGLIAHATANVALAPGLLLIPAYAGGQKKGWIAMSSFRDAATTSALQLGGGHWIAAGATAAITRITLTPAAGNFAIGSRLTIYAQGA